MKAALIALALIGFGIAGCSNAGKDKSTTKKHYKYHCVMHTDIGSDKPGVCSKCGMQLVESDDDN